MKVAYLVTGAACGHDYGVDNLFSGLVNNLGYANVRDWPEKPPLHCAVKERTHFDVPARDSCNIASDTAFPSRGTTGFDLLDADVALIAMPPYAPDAGRIAELCRGLPRSMPIAAIDASDHVENCASWYREVAGRPLAAYFKREYPIGETWAGTFACPLSYPASRVGPFTVERHGVFYHATDHGGGAPGVPRRKIVTALRAFESGPQPRTATGITGYLSDAMDLLLTHSQENRLSPEGYHERMTGALIGISWNGARNWDCNRFWENFAYGLCQVAETPRIQIPHPPLDGIDCFYVNTPEAVAPLVWALLHDETRARAVAQNGHAHFLKHHSSEARARYVLDTLERVG